MKATDVTLMRGCFPEGCVDYPYFKDRYAFQILAWSLGRRSSTVRELKAHPRWRAFLQRPTFKEFLQKTPRGVVTSENLLDFWPEAERIHCFRLSTGSWGQNQDDDSGWMQTSRKGWNLVLQLNFPAEHDRTFQRMCGECIYVFGSSSHPVRVGQINTMAWARIDADIPNRIALVEEVQTDWLREASDAVKQQRSELQKLHGNFDHAWLDTTMEMLLWYHDHYLAPLAKVWDEAMLSATLWYLREYAGMRSAYYHTWESGLWFKDLTEDAGPPRSLYTKLPQRFAFERASSGPGFILGHCRQRRKCKRNKKYRRRITPKWWQMNLHPTPRSIRNLCHSKA